MSALDLARTKVEEANAALRAAFDRSRDDPGGAAQEFAKLCARFPQAAAPLVGLAHIQRLIGADDDAARLLHLALQVEPNYADALNNLAVIMRKRNRHDEAIELMQRADKLKPFDKLYGANLVGLLRGRRRFDEAFAYSEAWAKSDPDQPLAWQCLAECLIHTRRSAASIAAAQRLIALRPNATSYATLARALEATGRYLEAVEIAKTATAIDPNDNTALSAEIETLTSVGRVHEAMPLIDILAGRDGEIDCRPMLSRAALLAGPCMIGWKAYEHRFDSQRLRLPKLEKERWLGGEVAGKRIALINEQGAGDNIQFARAAWAIAAQGGQALLHMSPHLAPLFTKLPPGVTFAPTMAPDAYDMWTPVLSAPLALNDPWCGSNAPYIFAPDGRAAPEPLRKPRKGLRVGMVWAGSPQHDQDHLRTCGLNAMMPLLGTPGVEFFALQKGPAVGEIQSAVAGALLTELNPHLHDWGDTAAAIAELDLVITVDTSVAHVAGAMGKPVWVMLQFAPDWRWGVESQTTHWYPSMRLYRQTTPLCWRAPVQAIGHDLAALAAQSGQSRLPIAA